MSKSITLESGITLIQLDDEASEVQELKADILKGAIYEFGKDGEEDTRLLEEETIDRLDHFCIAVYANEHPPPHFHVVWGREQNHSYSISDCSPLVDSYKGKYLKNIKKWHKKNKDFLISEWNRLRPTNCPVGEYKEATPKDSF